MRILPQKRISAKGFQYVQISFRPLYLGLSCIYFTPQCIVFGTSKYQIRYNFRKIKTKYLRKVTTRFFCQALRTYHMTF